MPMLLKSIFYSVMASVMALSAAAPPTDALAPFAAALNEPSQDDDSDDTLDEHEFFGRHLIATYLGCDFAALCDHGGLILAMERAVNASGAHRLETSRHAFPPHGFTALMLLSESHASIHTYPENRACFVDLFTCGRSCRAESFDAEMRRYLKPSNVSVRMLIRDTGIKDDPAHVV